MSTAFSADAPFEDRHISSTSTLVAQTTEDVRARTDPHLYAPLPNTESEDRSSEIATSATAAQSSSKGPERFNDQAHGRNKPGTLVKSTFQWWFITPLDVVLALSPLFFLGKTRKVIAALCIFLNNHPKSKYGEDIRGITLLSPTIFPIVYAAILGKMLRRVGLYKAERSATIGTVERLVGCQSLFSSFERLFAFKRFNLLGASILLAWLLSPLGDSVKYYPVEGFGRQTHLFYPKVAMIAWPLISPLYMTALLTSKKYLGRPMDLFDNVKIPDILQLPGYTGTSNDSQWHVVDRDSEIHYASALGIPVAGLPDLGNSSFDLVSHHWTVDCTAFGRVSTFNQTQFTGLPTFVFPFIIGSGADTQFSYQSRYVESEMNNSTGSYAPGTFSRANCTTYPLMVESHIQCQGRSCEVSKVRRQYRKPDDIIGNYEPASAWFGIISANMPGADLGMLQKNNASSELVEHWMVDPNLSTFQWDESLHLQQSSVDKRWIDVTKIPTETFSKRLQMAINTFWDASIGSTVRMGNLTKEQVTSFEAAGFKFTWNTTTMYGIRQEDEQYICEIQFAVCVIVISLLLFAAGVVSLVLGVLNKVPDTLGFVSTSARDNPYAKLHVPSHFDGLAAARELQDVRIRVGDVNGAGDIGHVAFATMDTKPKRVSRGRLYD